MLKKHVKKCWHTFNINTQKQPEHLKNTYFFFSSIKKEILAQVFSCEFSKFLRTAFFLKNTSDGCFWIPLMAPLKLFIEVIKTNMLISKVLNSWVCQIRLLLIKMYVIEYSYSKLISAKKFLVSWAKSFDNINLIFTKFLLLTEFSPFEGYLLLK